MINSAEKGMDFIQKIVRILATYEMELGEEELNNDTSVEEEENKIHNPKGIHLRFLTPDGFPMYQTIARKTLQHSRSVSLIRAFLSGQNTKRMA